MCNLWCSNVPMNNSVEDLVAEKFTSTFFGNLWLRSANLYLSHFCNAFCS